MIDHDELVRRSYELAPLSPTVVRLAALVGAPEADLQAVVRTLAMDPTLTGAVLRQANSAMFGGHTAVATVQDAVVRLGPGAILSLVLRTGLRATANRSLPEFGFSEGMFWRHSVAASLAVESMRRIVRTPIPPAAASAALLHDIGKLAMAQFLAPECLRSMWRSRTVGGRSRIDSEREILGVDHAEVGGLIAQHWRLPESMQHGILCHHDPERADSVLVDVVHVAAHIADRACPATDGAACDGPHREVLERLGLQDSHLDAIERATCEALAADTAEPSPEARR